MREELRNSSRRFRTEFKSTLPDFATSIADSIRASNSSQLASALLSHSHSSLTLLHHALHLHSFTLALMWATMDAASYSTSTPSGDMPDKNCERAVVVRRDTEGSPFSSIRVCCRASTSKILSVARHTGLTPFTSSSASTSSPERWSKSMSNASDMSNSMGMIAFALSMWCLCMGFLRFALLGCPASACLSSSFSTALPSSFSSISSFLSLLSPSLFSSSHCSPSSPPSRSAG
mmetsp:Transcript_3484/g.6844  ORF Transcript_3484/g.6844 Transcript_3484/m.6844 type:complete len:233 (+) Transcript_3484:257-955(+)